MSNTLLRASSINADERFWRRVRKTPYCWHWTGSKTRGYGMFSVHGRTVPAHVFAFVLHHGYWPKGDVCHGRDCEEIVLTRITSAMELIQKTCLIFSGIVVSGSSR